MIDYNPDYLITMRDIRAAGGCAPGARRWFNIHGLDFKKFIRDGGVLICDIIDIEDPFLTQLLQRVNYGLPAKAGIDEVTSGRQQ